MFRRSSKRLTFTRKIGWAKPSWECKKVFEPVTDSIRNISEDLPETMVLTSKEYNKALKNLNDELLEILNEGGENYHSIFVSSIENH